MNLFHWVEIEGLINYMILNRKSWVKTGNQCSVNIRAIKTTTSSKYIYDFFKTDH
jgi:hypothetical protein